MTIFVLLLFACVIIILALTQSHDPIFLVSLGILIVLFCGYLIDREMRLIRLTREVQVEQLESLEDRAKISILQKELEEIGALYKSLEAVSLEPRPENALEILLKSACDLFRVSRASIMLIDEPTQSLVIAASVGIRPEFQHVRTPVGKGVAGWVAAKGEPLLLSGTVKDDRFVGFQPKASAIHSAICAPLKSGGKTIGTINCSVTEPGRMFTEYDLQILGLFAQYAARTIELAQQRNAIRLHA